MGRRIVTAELQTAQVQKQGQKDSSLDDYFDIIVKYIPSDVIAAWLVVKSAVAGANSQQTRDLAMWVLFAVFLVITAVWTWLQTKEPGKKTATTQIIVATIAFFVWTMALGSPFTSLSWYEPFMGSVALVLFTLISGKIVPRQ